MKRLAFFAMVVTIIAVSAPGYAFFDYFFGGSATTDAIDNSVVGDLRAWWTGNPAYTFNPYYTPQSATMGQADPAAAQGQQGGPQYSTGVPTMQAHSAQQFQQPQMNYYPPQQQYGYPQQQAYPAPPQQYQPQPQAQQYQMPQQYAGPQQYQGAQQQYQQPQQYQQQGPGVLPQQYRPVNQGYQYQTEGAE